MKLALRVTLTLRAMLALCVKSPLRVKSILRAKSTLRVKLTLRVTAAARLWHGPDTLVTPRWTILGPAEGPVEAQDGPSWAPKAALEGVRQVRSARSGQVCKIELQQGHAGGLGTPCWNP